MTRGKCFLYDSGLRIPLIIRWPNGIKPPAQYKAGHVYEELVSGIDLAATSLAFAGLEKPAKMQGRVFMGPGAESARKHIYAAADRIGEIHHGIRCVRGKRYKYIRNRFHEESINEQSTAYRRAMHPIYHLLDKLSRENRLTPDQQALIEPPPKEELYDLETDPYEINNLAASSKRQEVLIDMRKAMDAWIAEIDDQGLKPDSPELAKHFERYAKISGAKHAEKAKALKTKVQREDEAWKAYRE